jgi:hypothetical protein
MISIFLISAKKKQEAKHPSMGLSITCITIIKNSSHYPEILKTEMDDIYHGTKPWNVLAVYVRPSDRI